MRKVIMFGFAALVLISTTAIASDTEGTGGESMRALFLTLQEVLSTIGSFFL